MNTVPDSAKEKLSKMQVMEQHMHNYILQRQSTQSQITEISSALTELESAKTTYKIIGNIMVLTDKEKLVSDLTEQKEKATVRIKTLEQQEGKIKERFEALQNEVMEEMKQ